MYIVDSDTCIKNELHLEAFHLKEEDVSRAEAVLYD